MNRKKLIGLITLMVISLAAIIVVQVVWLSNAIRVRNDLFDHLVANSLRNVAAMEESSMRMAFLNRQFLSNYNGTVSQPGLIGGNSDIGLSVQGSDYSFHVKQSSTTISSGNGVNEKVTGTIEYGGIADAGSDSVEIYVSTNGNPPVKMKVPGSQADSTLESVIVSPDEYRRWIQQNASEFQDVSSRLATEMYRWENEFHVNVDEIKNNLKNEFKASGIFTPFEFAIIKEDSVFDGLMSKVKPKEFFKSPYQVSLFSTGLLRKGEVLWVVFPDRIRIVLGSMIWMLIGSFLFSLIIISTFGLSLYMIVSQKKISEMKSDFINNMTHEFKTPIATISLAADTIANQKVINDEEKVRHFIGMIKKENARMNQQVENILQMSSLDKREMDFVFTETDLHEVIRKGVETIGIQVHERGGRIDCHLEAEKSIIAGDSEHLRNLVHNLLDNANKYTENKPEIKISTYNDDYGIFLVVEDNGIGMTKSVQSRIFERFYRQTTGNIHNVKGFGLGLNYVKSIVSAHNGTITVESEPGHGSRFKVFLPFNREVR